jgi:hypothetical protein
MRTLVNQRHLSATLTVNSNDMVHFQFLLEGSCEKQPSFPFYRASISCFDIPEIIAYQSKLGAKIEAEEVL